MSVDCVLSPVNAFSSLERQDESNGVHWALIVAGSNQWYNYRHQVWWPARVLLWYCMEMH